MRYGPAPPNVGLADVMAALRDPDGDACDGVLDRGDANEDEAHRIPEPLGAPDQAKVSLVGEDCLRDQRLASREEPSELQGYRPQPTKVSSAPGLRRVSREDRRNRMVRIEEDCAHKTGILCETFGEGRLACAVDAPNDNEPRPGLGHRGAGALFSRASSSATAFRIPRSNAFRAAATKYGLPKNSSGVTGREDGTDSRVPGLAHPTKFEDFPLELVMINQR
jgi:hypothetical protein